MFRVVVQINDRSDFLVGQLRLDFNDDTDEVDRLIEIGEAVTEWASDNGMSVDDLDWTPHYI